MNQHSKTSAIPVEQIASTAPFVIVRKVAFRDCDPAGIVYTPGFLDPISTSAWELCLAHLVGVYSERDIEVKGIDMSAKAVNLVFHSRVNYGDLLNLHAFCSKIRKTTFDLTVEGYSQEEELKFDSTITIICVNSTMYQSISVPEYLKSKLKQHLH